MDRSNLFKLMYKLNKLIKIINKYLYILPFITMLNNIKIFRDNKFYRVIYQIIKLLLIISIILSSIAILYFTDFTTPINNTYSLYYDLLEPYIELIKHLWNKLLIYIKSILNFPDSTIQSKNELESFLKDSTSQIKAEVKEGIKEGIREGLADAIDDLESNSDVLKPILIVTTGLFIFYIIFALPSEASDINSYNLINQSLINLKINIINLFSKPGNPGAGTAPTPLVVGDHPITEIVEDSTTSLNTIIPLETSNSGGSDVTITQDSIPLKKELVEIAIQTENGISVGTQTIADGISIGKLEETYKMVHSVLPKKASDVIIETVNNKIKKISD
jgi:hypothetical protein